MSLRSVAAADLLSIQSDSTTGFGWPFTLTAPDGTEYPLTGFSNDVALTVDPDTGQAVSGRNASVSVPIQALTNAGVLSLPVAIADTDGKPWRVLFNDIHGNPFLFYVIDTMPDRTIGNLVLILAVYRAA